MHYRRHLYDLEQDTYKLDDYIKKKRKRSIHNAESTIQRQRKKSVKRHKIIVRDKDGSLRETRQEDTLWYLLYVALPHSSKRLLALFRLRFRLPYQSYIDLSDEIYEDSNFEQWRNNDVSGESPSNLKLMLLGALRYIGRAWTYDDIAEANGISLDTNREFMNHCLDFGSKVFF